MRRLWTSLPILALTTLPSCAPAPAPAAAEPAATCDAATAAPWIGRTVDAGDILAARKASGARTTRVIRPGSMVTQDYREDRLNLEVDASGRVVSARCG